MASIDDIAVLTSENVRLTYTLAGMGSRVVAFLADAVIMTLSQIAVTFLFLSLGFRISQLEGLASGRGGSFVVALYIAVTFLIFWGYYFLFEWINWGQTPGKRVMGIRVAMADGAPADIVACAVRNVIRVIDLMFAGVGITFFILIFTPRYQRLGDLAAGTVVVKRRRLSFDDVLSAARSADRAAETASVEHPELLGRLRITDSERALIERFLARRESLPEKVRRDLVRDLAGRIRAGTPGDIAMDLDDEALIEAAYRQGSRSSP